MVRPAVPVQAGVPASRAHGAGRLPQRARLADGAARLPDGAAAGLPQRGAAAVPPAQLAAAGAAVLAVLDGPLVAVSAKLTQGVNSIQFHSILYFNSHRAIQLFAVFQVIYVINILQKIMKGHHEALVVLGKGQICKPILLPCDLINV